MLGEHRVIDVHGADAQSFLQGQLCNDVAALAPDAGQHTGYCTPKGRLLAAPVLLRREDGYRFVLPEPAIADAFSKRLGMFVMRADVQLERRDDLAVVALFGEGAPPFGLPALPQTPLQATEQPAGMLVRWHDDTAHGQRALAIVERQHAAGLPNGEAQWRLADIRAGIASVRSGTQESFVPQMLNLREIGALSFTKGCYPGQEIVARTQYLGKQKRYMQRFVATGAAADSVPLPVPGQTLGEGGACEVVDAVATPDGVELLAVVRLGGADGGVPLVDDAGEATAVATEAMLPYEIIAVRDAQAQADA